MFKVLITTVTTIGPRSVHTLIVEFDTKTDAETCIKRVHGYPCGDSMQYAKLLN